MISIHYLRLVQGLTITTGEHMKKVILSLLMGLSISDIALANSGEIIAKVGLDHQTKSELYGSMSTNSGKGHSISLEYLMHIPLLKFGAGVEYLLPRKFDKDHPGTFSFLPLYITIQVSPLFFYIKGNFGRNVCCTFDKRILEDVHAKNYYALAVGYEFPFGFIVELSHSRYEASGKLGSSSLLQGQHSDVSYIKNSLNFGYKFKT
jgi:hypothetical protein